MTDTTFTDKVTVIEASWLQDINNHVYGTATATWSYAGAVSIGGDLTISSGDIDITLNSSTGTNSDFWFKENNTNRSIIYQDNSTDKLVLLKYNADGDASVSSLSFDNSGNVSIAGTFQLAGSTVTATASELNTKELVFDVTLGTADDQHIVIPATGDITALYTVIDRALDTADETLTFKNNAGTSMTDGVITITQSGSADGDIDSETPSANNSFTAGQKMTVSIGGENGQAAICRITAVLTLT